MELKAFKTGAHTTFERLHPSGFYLVRLVDPSGNLQDKISCDTYKAAREYQRAFNKIARGMK